MARLAVTCAQCLGCTHKFGADINALALAAGYASDKGAANPAVADIGQPQLGNNTLDAGSSLLACDGGRQAGRKGVAY